MRSSDLMEGSSERKHGASLTAVRLVHEMLKQVNVQRPRGRAPHMAVGITQVI